jgi:hypothetical protein
MKSTILNDLGFYKYILIFFIISIIFQILLIIFTRFERVITINQNLTYGSGGGRSVSVNNMISDKEGRVYRVRNVLLLLHFTAAEVQAILEEGQTFKVKGYGLRIPFLGMYPTITKAEKA